MFWLTGSQKFRMMKNVSESLAGRVAVLTMLPMSEREIDGSDDSPFSPDISTLKAKPYEKKTQKEIFDAIFRGGMPRIVTEAELDRDLYYSSYMDTYIERDVSALEHVGKLDDFRNLVTYLAANTGHELV